MLGSHNTPTLIHQLCHNIISSAWNKIYLGRARMRLDSLVECNQSYQCIFNHVTLVGWYLLLWYYMSGLCPANERHRYKVTPSLIPAGCKPRISPVCVYTAGTNCNSCDILLMVFHHNSNSTAISFHCNSQLWYPCSYIKNGQGYQQGETMELFCRENLLNSEIWLLR